MAPVQRREAPAVPATATTATGIRAHVEHSTQGVKLWFGIDGSASLVAAKAAAILAELRRDGGLNGHRIASVVCNGTTLYAPPPPSPHEES